jgi:hypothetical protein
MSMGATFLNELTGSTFRIREKQRAAGRQEDLHDPLLESA